MVLVGVGAVMAVVAWVIVLLSPVSEHPLGVRHAGHGGQRAADDAGGAQNALPAAAAAAGHSIVELQATTSHGTVLLVGVAVAEGGLVATTADLLSGLRHLDMVGPGGKLQAARWWPRTRRPTWRWSTCPRIFRWRRSRTTAARQRGRRPGADLRAGRRPRRGAALHARCGDRRRGGHRHRPRRDHAVHHLVAGTPTSWPASRCSTPAGSVLGILYDPDPGASPATFLPSDLVVGVADDLRSQDRVVHGWLGVEGTDAPDGGGATVAAGAARRAGLRSPAGGAAHHGHEHHPGALHGRAAGPALRVAPGTAVSLSVAQPAGTKVVDVTLGTSS